MSASRVLLVTGASGLVGGEIVRRALARSDFAKIVALGRSGAPPAAGPRVRVVRGDVVHPGLGLSTADHESLRTEVTDVLHAAADTRFNRSLTDARRANVDGTQNVLALARAAPRLRRLVHVSTVHVAGLTAGRIPEDALAPAGAYANTYQRSKHEAEALVFDAAPALPAHVVRLSTLVGQSDGRVLRPNYVHALMRLLPLRLSPVVAIDPEARVDLVASDWALDALYALLAAEEAPRRVSHLCAGETRCLRVATLMEEVSTAFERHLGSAVPLPRIVSAEEYREHVDGLRRAGSRTAVRILEALELFLPHLRLRQVYEDRATARSLEGRCPAMSDPLDTFRRVARWCLETDYGARCDGARREPAAHALA